MAVWNRCLKSLNIRQRNPSVKSKSKCIEKTMMTTIDSREKAITSLAGVELQLKVDRKHDSFN